MQISPDPFPSFLGGKGSGLVGGVAWLLFDNFPLQLKNKLQLFHVDLSCEHDVGVPSAVLPVTMPHFTGFISTVRMEHECLRRREGSRGGREEKNAREVRHANNLL